MARLIFRLFPFVILYTAARLFHVNINNDNREMWIYKSRSYNDCRLDESLSSTRRDLAHHYHAYTRACTHYLLTFKQFDNIHSLYVFVAWVIFHEKMILVVKMGARLCNNQWMKKKREYYKINNECVNNKSRQKILTHVCAIVTGQSSVVFSYKGNEQTVVPPDIHNNYGET
jgi:hypothetical protein